MDEFIGTAGSTEQVRLGGGDPAEQGTTGCRAVTMQRAVGQPFLFP